MTRKKSAKKGEPMSASAAAGAAFNEVERAAMRERVKEMRAAARRAPRGNAADGESALLEKIAAMPDPDRQLGERLHAIVKANAPALWPKLWYGMPAYANKDGNVVCFFQDSQKFRTRYATLGFSDKARLDDGKMWPTAYALTELTPAEESRIAALLKKAVG